MRLTQQRQRQLRTIFWEIVEHYGESKYQDWTPDINIYHDDTKLGLMGEWSAFDEGADCSVNLAPCRTMREAVKYMIHEYTHHLQSPTWYTRYDNMYGYWDNPYEIEAQAVADRDVHIFWPPREPTP